MAQDRFALPRANLIQSRAGGARETWQITARTALVPLAIQRFLPTIHDIHVTPGKLAYGVQERLCLRPSPTTAAAAPPLWSPRQPLPAPASAAPAAPSRRHDPYAAYLAGIKQREREQGIQRTLVRELKSSRASLA